MSWDGLLWRGESVVIIGSGASLTEAQCELVRRWRFAAPARKVIVINTTFKRAPWADVLYGCDYPWWQKHYCEAASVFGGELWSQDQRAVVAYRVSWIQSLPGRGLGVQPGVIHQGQNGGYQAVNLAYQAGAKQIYLLGFDMHGGHWHGDHPLPLTNPKPWLFGAFIQNFQQLARDLRTRRVEVVNCTPGSKLDCFPMVALDTALAEPVPA